MDENPSAQQEPTDQQRAAEIRALIDLACETFRRELPALLESNPEQWIAYRGSERLGIGHTKGSLLDECLKRDISNEEILIEKIVTGIEPMYAWWPSGGSTGAKQADPEQ